MNFLPPRIMPLNKSPKPNFKRAKIFHHELMAIQVDFAILDLSKVHMYSFHYNVWMKKFPKSPLLFTATDSLCYAVEDMTRMVDIQEEFDFSEYPPKHPKHEQNMKVIGKFKDELHSCALTKFVGLRPKLYSYEYEEEGKVVEKNITKGVKTKVKNTKLTFADY